MGTYTQSNPGSGPFHLATLWESKVATCVKWSGSTVLLNGPWCVSELKWP